MQDTEEIWKDIPGYEGFYQASSLGRIKRLATKVNHSSGVLASKKERILRLALCKTGYFGVSLCKNNVKINYPVYKLIAIAFHQKPDGKKMAVNHINCNKSDNRACNLEWVTTSGNRIHAIMNRLIKTIPPEKLLTKSKINTIINLRMIGYNQMDLARIFKINQSAISRALGGKRGYAEILNSK